MRILRQEHWMVKLNRIFAAILLLCIYTVLLRSEMAQSHASVIWSLEFVGFTIFSIVISVIVAGAVLNIGYVFMSAIYCIATHDPKNHWLARTIIGAKSLINRPSWMAENGL